MAKSIPRNQTEGTRTPNSSQKKPTLKGPFKVMEVEAWRTPGTFCDGGGLYLRVEWRMKDGKPTVDAGAIKAWKTSGRIGWTAEDVTKTWCFRYWLRGPGKRTLREMGLGSTSDLTLKEAREVARDQRVLLSKFKDPITHRNTLRAEMAADLKKQITFAQAAERYWGQHRDSWKNEKHAENWLSGMKIHIFPRLGSMQVTAIKHTDVLDALLPIWNTKADTAAKVRARIEKILNWCKVRGYVKGDNAAAWKGNLEAELPPSTRVKNQKHHPALPYREVASFVALLQQREAIAARALEFLILTATRTGEVIGATWDEIDLDHKLWTIPAERMKAGKEHFIPLSHRALDILHEMEKVKIGAYVFPGPIKSGEPLPLSNMAMNALLKRMERTDITVHGFRATFKTWAGDRSIFEQRLIENALAHQIKDKAEAAYSRGTMIEKRIPLMEAWAKYCATTEAPADNVVPIQTAR